MKLPLKKQNFSPALPLSSTAAAIAIAATPTSIMLAGLRLEAIGGVGSGRPMLGVQGALPGGGCLLRPATDALTGGITVGC